MTEPTITPEQVMAGGVKRRDAARRLAGYANLRADGALIADAARRVGITSTTTAKRYERWLTRFRHAYGLPDLPEQTPTTGFTGVPPEDRARASVSGTHTRWHAARGVTSPSCPLCRGGRS